MAGIKSKAGSLSPVRRKQMFILAGLVVVVAVIAFGAAMLGGLSKAGKLIFEPTQWYMEENMLFVFKNKVKLLPSGIQGKNAAILGASALIWQEAAK
jgi:hypothetical protein